MKPKILCDLNLARPVSLSEARIVRQETHQHPSSTRLNARFCPHAHLPAIGPERPFSLAAALHLALIGGVMIFWGNEIFIFPLAPITVAMVHLYVLGVLTMALFGSAYRLLPLWTGMEIPWPGLRPWTIGLLIIGALSMFLGIGPKLHRWFLLSASAGVGLACGFFLLQTGLILLKTPSRKPLIPLLRLSILALTGVFFLGAVFLGEYAHGFLPYDRFAMVGTHLGWGLFGWAGLLIMVIRLTGSTGNAPWMIAMAKTGALACLLLIPAGLFLLPEEPRWLWLTMASGGITMMLLTLASRHPGLEQNNAYQLWGDIFGACSLLILLLWPVWLDDRLRFLFGLLLLPGWSLSQLFGIFDSWRPARLGGLHKICHFAGVVLPVLSLFTGLEALLQLGGGMHVVSAGMLIRALREKTP